MHGPTCFCEECIYGVEETTKEKIQITFFDYTELCTDVLQGISLITDYIKESQYNMLPQPKTTNQPTSNRGRSSSSRNGNLPFLKSENLTEAPRKAKILGVRPGGPSSFNDVIVKVNVGGTNYFWGLRANNPNYAFLFETFGPDENEWEGKEFNIGLRYDEFSEKNLIHATSITEEKTSRKK